MSLAVTGAALDGEVVGLRIEDGAIAELGPSVEPKLGDDLIDAAGLLLTPPMVNGHTHAAMTLFRGFGDDMALMEWLRTRIWPAEARLEPEDVYWGTRLACVEMIRSGTTKFLDMYWHGVEVARAVVDSGIRATVSAVMIDQLDPARGEGMRPEVLESLDRIAEAGPRVTPSLGPHAIYTVSPESLAWLAEIGAEREIPLQIHLSETEREVSDCRDAQGKRPAAYLDDLGFLGERSVLAHGVWLDRGELELIAERGATVVANPAANMKLAVGGVLPYPARSGRRRRDRAGHRRRLLELQPRHVRGGEALRPQPEARQRRPRDVAGGRGTGDRPRAALPGARWDGARGRAARRLPASPRLGSRALGR